MIRVAMTLSFDIIVKFFLLLSDIVHITLST